MQTGSPCPHICNSPAGQAVQLGVLTVELPPAEKKPTPHIVQFEPPLPGRQPAMRVIQQSIEVVCQAREVLFTDTLAITRVAAATLHNVSCLRKRTHGRSH